MLLVDDSTESIEDVGGTKLSIGYANPRLLVDLECNRLEKLSRTLPATAELPDQNLLLVKQQYLNWVPVQCDDSAVRHPGRVNHTVQRLHPIHSTDLPSGFWTGVPFRG